MASENYTLEELLICRMAKEFSGERVAASATILGDISARLAKALYAPEIVLLAGGSQASFDAPVGSNFITGEWETGRYAALSMEWRELFELIAHGNLMIFMGPVQIDKVGNANISVLGPWEAPKVQMIGARGLPDDLWGNHTFLFHVSRHSKRSFVERIDFKCSIGYGEERRKLGLTSGKPKVVISDLGVFAWDLETGAFRIESLHPGISFKDVQDNTAFALDDDPKAIYLVTPAPTAKELYWIREKIDPAGWRRTAAKDQPASLRELAAKEIAAMGLSRGTT